MWRANGYPPVVSRGAFPDNLEEKGDIQLFAKPS
jgi:hypothetical protein